MWFDVFDPTSAAVTAAGAPTMLHAVAFAHGVGGVSAVVVAAAVLPAGAAEAVEVLVLFHMLLSLVFVVKRGAPSATISEGKRSRSFRLVARLGEGAFPPVYAGLSRLSANSSRTWTVWGARLSGLSARTSGHRRP